MIGVVGPMARTVADVKALFEAMQGPDDGDTCAAPVPLRQPGNGEIRKLRIAYFEDDGRTPCAPQQKLCAEAALKSNSFTGKASKRQENSGGSFS
jgi:Asp-tRNA(Asn)/Glu-tRNA(Gln) amidotransferase A subunit family amidase